MLLLLQWLHDSKIFFFEWKRWLMQLCYHIFNSMLYWSTVTKGNKGIFLFFNYEATGPPGAGLQEMYVFIIGRCVDAGFYTWLNWSFPSDLSALVQLHCVSWMFHGKVGWFWALPSPVCCLTETHWLWGRVEVKSSRHDKQRTPGATSDMQPPTPNPWAHRRQASMSEQRGVQLCAQIPTFAFVSHADMCCSHVLSSLAVVYNQNDSYLSANSLFARLLKCM